MKVALLVAQGQIPIDRILDETDLPLEQYIDEFVKKSGYLSHTLLVKGSVYCTSLLVMSEGPLTPTNTLGLLAFVID